jgi:hypothetical protein
MTGVSMTQTSALGTKQRKIALGSANLSVGSVVESVGMEPCFRNSALKHAEYVTDHFPNKNFPHKVTDKGIIVQYPNK